MIDNLVLSPVPIDEFIERIREVIKEEVKKEQEKSIGEKLISPAEACKLFIPKISRVTLDAWTKAGYLTRRDIGGRVYYKYSDIISATKTLKKYSRI